MLKRILPIILAALLIVGQNPLPVYSAVDSCTASVSPTSMRPSTPYDLVFTVTNTSVDSIVWVKITRPSANFTLEQSTSSWTTTDDGESYTYTGNSIAAAGQATFTIQVTSGADEISAANWTIQTSGSASGTSPVTCTGTLGVSISSSADQSPIAPPTISGIAVSSITTSSVVISWTTSKNTDAIINYGPTDSYVSSATNSTQTTAHSLTISGLTADSTYHYQLYCTDNLGQSVVTADNTFTTAKVTATTTTTTTTTTTVTATPTPTPTATVTTSPTPAADRTPPEIKITTDLAKPFKQAPKIIGNVTDNTSVISIAYSTDGGRNYLPVDLIISSGAKTTAFEFTPPELEDDNYELKIQAKDTAGNSGQSQSYTLVIDRLPPQVGATLIAVGPQSLYPDTNGDTIAIAGVDEKIYLSSVGGAISINLESKGQTFSLVKDADNGLWSGRLSFSKTGTYPLLARSLDGAGNKTTRQLNSITVVKKGALKNGSEAVKNAEVSVFYLDDSTSQFNLWDADPYDQKNPQKVDKDGQYQFFLPPGRYYLLVKAGGFKILKTAIFNLEQSTPINTDFQMEDAATFKIGPWKINLPDFGQSSATINLTALPPVSAKEASKIVGKELPNINLFSDTTVSLGTAFLGKPTVVTLLNSWAPQSASQISILEDLLEAGEVNAVVVVPQESAPSVQIYKKRGDYGLPILADPDGLIVPRLNFSTQPTHLFVNRKGIVADMKVGIFTADQLLDSLLK